MRTGFATAALLVFLVLSPLTAQVIVSGKVLDDNGVAVAGARVELRDAASETRGSAVTDISGAFYLELAKPGQYQLRAERRGFFVLAGKPVTFESGSNQLVINLNRLQEFAESIEVTYSPPAIDFQEPADEKRLESVEILTVPHPAAQDLRNALPLLNGVVQDNSGRLHFNGGATDQTNFMLDGFHISDPVTGRFDARINIDTVRSLDLASARFTAEKGRGSAGSLDLQTKMGDDRWRWDATGFFPGVSTNNGLHVDKWSPQLALSGPLAKGRAWFHNGLDVFYDVDVIRELPRGQNRRRGLTTSNLSRFQVNLTSANILTGSFLVNYSDTIHNGLSMLDPIETTTNRHQDLYMFTARDQMYFHGGALVEVGFSEMRGVLRQVPQGEQVFEITPDGRRGNYFVHLNRHSRRQEWLANAFLPSMHGLGSHQLKIGADVERTGFHQAVDRHDYHVLRTDWSLVRSVSFEGNRFQGRTNVEASQYVQDRWTPRDGLLIEAGLRADWDQIVRDIRWSPRLSFAWAPKRLRDTKIAGGYGVFYDALALGTLSQDQDQASFSTFYLPSGAVSRGPVMTAFLVNDHELRVPRFRTLSLSVERKLPLELYAKSSYVHKEGTRGFVFVNDLLPAASEAAQGGMYQLRNWRHDRYDALELSVRRTFAGQFEWSAGYTRSSARANAVVTYSVENPIFATQAPGPYSWDTPNRFLTWGWAPLSSRLLPRSLAFVTRNTSVAYLIEYRTGFPFDVVNEEGVLVGAPNSHRLPSYFNINLHFERKFRLLHYLWAWRFGMNNLTNSGNPNIVNNNIDSPAFLTYGRGQLRAFAVRLRLLGKR